MRLAISLSVAILTAASVARAQEAAYIDVRAGSEPEPQVTAGSTAASSAACNEAGCHSELKTEITRLVQHEQHERRMAEWTIRIINVSNEPLKVPTSSKWSSEPNTVGTLGRRVLMLSIGQSASCANVESGLDISSTALYGSVANNTDTIALGKGQWITVSGRGPACESPTAQSDKYAFNVSLTEVHWLVKDQQIVSESKPLANDGGSLKVVWNDERDYEIKDSVQK